MGARMNHRKLKTCLEALSSLLKIHAITVEDIETTDEILRDIAVRLFIAKHDSNEAFAEMASTAYANAGVSFAMKATQSTVLSVSLARVPQFEKRR